MYVHLYSALLWDSWWNYSEIQSFTVFRLICVDKQGVLLTGTGQ